MFTDSQGRVVTYQGNCSKYNPNKKQPIRDLKDISLGQIYRCLNLEGSVTCFDCTNRSDKKPFKSPSSECLSKTLFNSSYMTNKTWEYAGRRNIFHGKIIDIELVDDTTTVVGMLDDITNEERCFIIKDSDFDFEFTKFISTKYDMVKDRIRFFAQRDTNNDKLPWTLIGFMTDLGHEGGKTTFTN